MISETVAAIFKTSTALKSSFNNNLQDLLSTGGQRSFIAAANKQINKETVNITLEAVLILLEVMPHLLHSHLFLNLLTAEWL